MWRRTGHARSGLWIVGHIAARLSNHINERVERTWSASAVDDKRCQKLSRTDAYKSAPNAIIPNYIYIYETIYNCMWDGVEFFLWNLTICGPLYGPTPLSRALVDVSKYTNFTIHYFTDFTFVCYVTYKLTSLEWRYIDEQINMIFLCREKRNHFQKYKRTISTIGN